MEVLYKCETYVELIVLMSYITYTQLLFFSKLHPYRTTNKKG